MTRPDYVKIAETQRREYPYVLAYTRRGGPTSTVGLVVGSRSARDPEHAAAMQRSMEREDTRYGHVTSYEIRPRAVAKG